MVIPHPKSIIFLVMSHELPFHKLLNYCSADIAITRASSVAFCLIILNIAWYTEFCIVLFMYNHGRDELKFVVEKTPKTPAPPF
jgi:hypothetical protein